MQFTRAAAANFANWECLIDIYRANRIDNNKVRLHSVNKFRVIKELCCEFYLFAAKSCCCASIACLMHKLDIFCSSQKIYGFNLWIFFFTCII